MMLLPVILLAILVESLLAVALGAAGAASRLQGDRRWGSEAELILESALALARVDHAAPIAMLAPGATIALPVTVDSPWEAEVVAVRPMDGQLIRLVARVRRPAADGTLLAGRAGTLLLQVGVTDTAIVITERSRY